MIEDELLVGLGPVQAEGAHLNPRLDPVHDSSVAATESQNQWE